LLLRKLKSSRKGNAAAWHEESERANHEHRD
jgi:hypothetical protein